MNEELDFPPLEDVMAIIDAVENDHNLNIPENYESDSDSDLTSDTDDDYERNLELEEEIGVVNIGLSIDQLEKLPFKILVEKSETLTDTILNIPEISNYMRDIEDYKSLTCSICLEEYKKNDIIIQLDCNHFFHSECIKNWLHEKKVCVLCKKEINYL